MGARPGMMGMGARPGMMGMGARPGMNMAGRSFGASNFGRAGVNNFGRAGISNGGLGMARNAYGLGTRAPITSAARMGGMNFAAGWREQQPDQIRAQHHVLQSG